jgi:hypothetical protein
MMLFELFQMNPEGRRGRKDSVKTTELLLLLLLES